MRSSDSIAAVSLIVATASAAFAFYQWQRSEKENKINAAIDLSIKQLVDPGWTKDRSDFINYVAGKQTPEDAIGAANYIISLDYVAYLMNSGNIDSDYVSHHLKCSIYVNYENIFIKKAFSNIVNLQTIAVPDMKKFYDSNQGLNCVPQSN